MRLGTTSVMSWHLWPVLLLKAVLGSSIAAWTYSTLASPQVIHYDDTTGQIFYSLCNSNTNPIFPANETAAFPLDVAKYPPLNGTSVAAAGYQSDGKHIAALFYQTKAGAIAQALFTCNDTGHWYFGEGQNTTDLTTGQGLSVLNQTGLAVVNLPNDPGTPNAFRLYYRNSPYHHIQELVYDPYRVQWFYNGEVSQAPSMMLEFSASYLDEERLTVISPGNESFFYVNTKGSSNWDIKSFPQWVSYEPGDNDTWVYPLDNNTADEGVWNEGVADWNLPHFDNNAVLKTGMAMDSAAARYIFYIGSTRDLYQVNENGSHWDDAHSAWQKESTDNDWPAADTQYADIGTTYDSDANKIWIYYISNGTMIQVYRSSATQWETAIALPMTLAQEEGRTKASGGLTSQAKIGLGVGIGAGVAVVGAIAACFFYSRKRSGAEREGEAPPPPPPPPETRMSVASPAMSMPGTSFVSELPDVDNAANSSNHWKEGGYWVNGLWVPARKEPYYAQEGEGLLSSRYYDDPNKAQFSPPPTAEMPATESKVEVGGGAVMEMDATEELSRPRKPAGEEIQPHVVVTGEEANRVDTVEDNGQHTTTTGQPVEHTTTVEGQAQQATITADGRAHT